MPNNDPDRTEQPEAETIAERLLQRISESTESTIQEIMGYVEQIVSGTGEYDLGGETKLKMWRTFLVKGGFELIDGFLKTKVCHPDVPSCNNFECLRTSSYPMPLGLAKSYPCLDWYTSRSVTRIRRALKLSGAKVNVMLAFI